MSIKQLTQPVYQLTPYAYQLALYKYQYATTCQMQYTLPGSPLYQ